MADIVLDNITKRYGDGYEAVKGMSLEIADGELVGSLPARAGDPLPDKSPAEVLTLLGQHSTRTFSGTIEQVSDLGLPELPAATVA